MPFHSYFSSIVNIYLDMHFHECPIGTCVRELYLYIPWDLPHSRLPFLIYSICITMTHLPGPSIPYLRISPVLTSNKPYHALLSH